VCFLTERAASDVKRESKKWDTRHKSHKRRVWSKKIYATGEGQATLNL